MGLSSEVITEVKDWQDIALLVPHEPLRFLLSSVENINLDTVEKVKKFGAVSRAEEIRYMHELHAAACEIHHRC